MPAKSIAALKTAADLTQKLDELKKSRVKHEKDWKLNLAFYRNNQWCYVAKSGRLETLPVEDGEKPRYRVRLTANQITPGVQSLLAKLTKTRPVLNATPQSSSMGDVKAAQMSELLLEDWWVSLGLEDKLEEALLWALIAGQGYWKISWDQHASKPMKFTMNPQGQVITDDNLVTQYKHQLTQVGLPEDYADKTIFMGDVRVDVLSPFQVWIDPAAKTFSEAKWAICEHSLSRDEIKNRFGRDIEPDSVPTDPDKSLPYNQSDENGSMTPTVKKVYFGYFLPQAALPKGRYVVWVEDGGGGEGQPEGAGDQNILYDEPWNTPSNELPLVKFGGVRVPGSTYDDAVVTMARPLQKELNRTVSQIVEYKNLTIKPRVWAPIGSLKTRLTSEPGAVYEFQPIAGLRPEIEQLPAMPPYVFNHLEDITRRLKEVFGLNEVSEGTVPPNVEAGVAIDLLQEMSTDRIAPQIKMLEVSLARAAKLLLILAQKYYIEERQMKIAGGGGSTRVKKFRGADIAGGIDVTAESGSGLPRTRAGRQARIESFIDRGILSPQKAWKYVDLADMKSVAASFMANEDQALREHDKILEGEPLNRAAMNQAIQAVMQGVNPDTGEQLSGDPAEMKGIIERAAFMPGPADDHPTHLEQHQQFLVSVEFEALDPETQRLFYLHYQLTVEAAKEGAPIPEGQAPRVSLSMHGTLGPTVASKIMNQAGVQTQPEEFMEQPLETLVMDSVDAPDQDDAANDPYTQAEQLHGMALDEAKAMAETELTYAKVETEKAKAKAALRPKPASSSGGK
jgi:hypothetical protein